MLAELPEKMNLVSGKSLAPCQGGPKDGKTVKGDPDKAVLWRRAARGFQ